jgi:predicted ArsR family transcriptional regulator
MAEDARIPSVPFNERLNMVVTYLNDNGYGAHWEQLPEGYLLHTSNCPYHSVAHNDLTLCEMDMRLISSLLGIVPRRVYHLADGDASCSYLIPVSAN